MAIGSVRRGRRTHGSRIRRAVLLGAAVLVANLPTGCAGSPEARARQRSSIGINIDLMDTLYFTDAAKTLREFADVDGTTLPPELLDEHGWPRTDAMTVIFDHRPIPAWDPPIDDPEQYQIDLSGVYAMSFTGRADVANGIDPAGPQAEIRNVVYDEATNTTTGEVVMPPGNGLLILEFTNTQRAPDAPVGSGITNLRVIRPGFDPDDHPTINPVLPQAIARIPFHTLRYLDVVLNIRDRPFPQELDWDERKLPTDATQLPFGEKRGGAAWEYVIELANITMTNPWINVPVDASDEYVARLAELVRDTLDPALIVYVEHSNEVWNRIFTQEQWNAQAAVAEVTANPESLLDADKPPFEQWALRRHARRTAEIGQIFSAVFDGVSAERAAASAPLDPASIRTTHPRIRPVFAWWSARRVEYLAAFEWLLDHYAPPSELFWGAGYGTYFVNERSGPDADPGRMLDVMEQEVAQVGEITAGFAEIGEEWNVHVVVYEGGPDTGMNGSGPFPERVIAERSERMGDLVYRSIIDEFFPNGGDLYVHYKLVSKYGRWGSWGLTDDIHNLDRNYKFHAMERAAAEAPRMR